MNRLWVRLSFAFGGVLLLGVFANVVVISLFAQSGLPHLLLVNELRRSDGLLQQIEAYYARTGSWETFADDMGAQIATYGQPEGSVIYVTDAAGKAVFPTSLRFLVREGPLPRRDALPIIVDGETVGYLNVVSVPPPPDRRVGVGLIQGVVLNIVVVGGIIGVIFGTLVSRTMTAPLSRLAGAARAIGARKLNQRVELKGSREIQEVAQAFNEMASGLEAAERLRSNLVADVAHELRTPLSVLQGNLRAILDDVYPLDKTELTRLYEQTRVLSRLVNDLHELSQAEARQLHLNLQPVNPARVVEDVLGVFKPIAEEEGLTIEFAAPEHVPPVQADSVRLSQVLHNLLNNALRYTPRGGKITLRIEPAPNQVKIIIADTGEGISAEHLPHVFERFYRVDKSRSRVKGGTGLGLAISQAIIQAHGGKIDVASDGVAGHGSTFTIVLPVSPNPSP